MQNINRYIVVYNAITLNEDEKKDDFSWGCLIAPFAAIILFVALTKGCGAAVSASGKIALKLIELVFGLLFFFVLGYAFWKIFIEEKR